MKKCYNDDNRSSSKSVQVLFMEELNFKLKLTKKDIALIKYFPEKYVALEQCGSCLKVRL